MAPADGIAVQDTIAVKLVQNLKGSFHRFMPTTHKVTPNKQRKNNADITLFQARGAPSHPVAFFLS
jgi:hypothetical protein